MLIEIDGGRHALAAVLGTSGRCGGSGQGNRQLGFGCVRIDGSRRHGR